MYRCGTLLHIGHAYKYSVRLCIHVRNYGVCFFNMKQIHFIIFLLCIKKHNSTTVHKWEQARTQLKKYYTLIGRCSVGANYVGICKLIIIYLCCFTNSR